MNSNVLPPHLQEDGLVGFSPRAQQLSSASGHTFPLLAPRNLDLPAADSPHEGHREPDNGLSVGRRDMDGERNTCDSCQIDV